MFQKKMRTLWKSTHYIQETWSCPSLLNKNTWSLYPKKLGWSPPSETGKRSEKSCEFQVPILALHGLEDQVLPPDCSKILVQRADGVKSVRLQLLEKDTHRMESALPHVLDFIFHHAPREKGRAELKKNGLLRGAQWNFYSFFGGMVLGVNQKAQEWVAGIHHLGFGIHHLGFGILHFSYPRPWIKDDRKIRSFPQKLGWNLMVETSIWSLFAGKLAKGNKITYELTVYRCWHHKKHTSIYQLRLWSPHKNQDSKFQCYFWILESMGLLCSSIFKQKTHTIRHTPIFNIQSHHGFFLSFFFGGMLCKFDCTKAVGRWRSSRGGCFACQLQLKRFLLFWEQNGRFFIRAVVWVAKMYV